MPSRQSICIVIENLTVPLDRRVWQEARTLRDAGYTVSVICPRGGSYTAAYEVLEDIHVFRHPLPIEADGALGYALEYTYALFWEFVLSIKVRAKVGFDVIQACNPPDTIFLLALFWKILAGTKFVFDHHDVNPELYEAKFGKRGAVYKILLLLERLTFRTADVAIATNESYREIALSRGGMDPSRVFVVRSTPDLTRFQRTAPNPSLRNGRKHLVGYVGVMGAQDGVDLLIKAMGGLVHTQGRRDIQCVIVGRGTEIPNLQHLVGTLKLEEFVTFAGYLEPKAFLSAYSTFDIGVVPDPKNDFNDKCSMNKVVEYMTLGIPLVGFDLIETRRTAGDAALYAANNSAADLAAKIAMLCDHPELRERQIAAGKARAAALLHWQRDAAELLRAYDKALEPRPEFRPAGIR